MTLTERQAYDAMFLFLLEYWERGKRSSDDLGNLLHNLDKSLWENGRAGDPAMDNDWASCVERIKSGLDPYRSVDPA